VKLRILRIVFLLPNYTMFVICWDWPGPEAMTPIRKAADNQTIRFPILLTLSCWVAA